MPQQSDNRPKCSFCGKKQDQVKKLIAGQGVYVCNECVDLCNELLDEEFPSESGYFRKLKGSNPSQQEPPNPLEAVPEGILFTAMISIEALIETYEAGLQVEWLRMAGGRPTAEPFYRVLLALQERQFGSLDIQLLPILEKLYEIYDRTGQLENGLHTLKWIISINKAPKQPTRTELLLKLARLHIKLNQHSQAEELISKIIGEIGATEQFDAVESSPDDSYGPPGQDNKT